MMPLAAGLLLAAVTVTYHPVAPAVGDLITIDFPAPVRLEPSESFEVVGQQGQRVVVRTFRPAPFVMHGVTGDVQFQNLVVPVRSVLDPNLPMTPAPLAPPREVPYEPDPFYAIAAAALTAALVWFLVWRRSRVRSAHAEPQLSAEERFVRAVAALRGSSRDKRWAALADETRRFLAATRPHLGAELTTRELVPRLRDREQIVATILRQGDLEKFSTGGADPLPFEEFAAEVLDLTVPEAEETEVAAS